MVSVSDCSFILSFILPGERWGAGDSGNSRDPRDSGDSGLDLYELYDLFVYAINAFTLLNMYRVIDLRICVYHTRHIVLG